MDFHGVRVLRGDLLESVHHVVACVVGTNGAVQLETDDGAPRRRIFIRSAAKPFQALPAVRGGVLEAYGLDDRHLAVACASHIGRHDHVRLVEEILSRAGVPESALTCGMPHGEDLLGLMLHGVEPRPIHHNCSGNHALALACAQHEGLPLDGYLSPQHPVQRAMREAVLAEALLPAAELGLAVDGCGMPAYRVPLSGLATAYARLAAGAGDAALARVGAAMQAHPELVRGPGEVDTELMRLHPGCVAKVGAEGVFALGTGDGRGLALKVLDGGWRALAPAAIAASESGLGLDVSAPALAALRTQPVAGAGGEPLARIESDIVWRAL